MAKIRTLLSSKTKLDPRTVLTWTLLALAILTTLNVIIGRAFPEVPILQTGFAWILIMASIVLSLLFSITFDKKIEKIELITIAIILITMFGIYYLTKTFVPEIYSLLPEATREVVDSAFSILN